MWTYRCLFDRAAHEPFCKFFRRPERTSALLLWVGSCVVLFFVLVVIQAKHEQVNFRYRKSSKYTIQVCKHTEFENLVRCCSVKQAKICPFFEGLYYRAKHANFSCQLMWWLYSYFIVSYKRAFFSIIEENKPWCPNVIRVELAILDYCRAW